MAACMRAGEEEEMVTDAPAEREASATAKPMPEEPPMTRTCFCASLLYFWEAIVCPWFLSDTFRGYDRRILQGLRYDWIYTQMKGWRAGELENGLRK